jgi:hypothetical protein
MNITPEQRQDIKDRKITHAILVDNSKVRIFISTCNNLCQHLKGSRRKGFIMDAANILSLVAAKTPKNADEREFNTINKFRKQALKAKFTNSFITDCKKLPDTFEKWVEAGKKSAYELGVTTGCKVTGDLISVKTVCKGLNSYYAEGIKNAIENQTSFSTGRFPFQGYEGSVEFRKNEDGTFQGWLSKEYKNCGNGYYFLLINNEYFIGYDVD